MKTRILYLSLIQILNSSSVYRGDTRRAEEFSFSILHFPFSIVQDYRCCFDLFALLLNDMANIVIIRGGVVGTEMTAAAFFTEEGGTDD